MEAAKLQAKGDAAVITERAKATAAGEEGLVMRVGWLDHCVFEYPTTIYWLTAKSLHNFNG